MSIYNPRGGYENRSLLKEAITNRVVREFELESLYKGPEVAAVEIMHKYDGTRNDMAWVLMGDSITKSAEVYSFIDSVIKNQPGEPWNPSANRDPTLGQKNRGDAAGMMPGPEAAGLGGGASQGTAGGAQQSHPAQQGLGSRFKTWAKDRAAPAIGRGLRHMGAGLAGGLATANPLGVIAGAGASMYQAHKAKQDPNNPAQKVMGGEGGLNQLAGDAAKQGAVGVKNAAAQQQQNFQQGQGAAGKVGQVAGSAKNMAQGAWQGMKNLGSNMVSGAKNAVADAGAAQQANFQQANPEEARRQQREAGGQLAVQQQQAANMMPPQPTTQGGLAAAGASASSPPAGGAPPHQASGTPVTQPPAPGAQQPPNAEIAQADPSAIGDIAQSQGPQVPGQQQQQLGANPGMFGAEGTQTTAANDAMNQVGQQNQQQNKSSDSYSAISNILKGW